MSLTFLPQPRKTEILRGTYSLFPSRLVVLQAPAPQALVYTARRLLQALPDSSNLRWELAAGERYAPTLAGLTLRVDLDTVPQPQGYRLLITPDGMNITGHDEAGVFYGACTLTQILRQVEKNRLPCLEISDWPDYLVRGVLLDISRDKVPQMSTLYELVDRLAGWKVNQLQLYTEHTFAYRNHPEVWAKASPLTGGEILALDAYCRENFIELVPNQASFGHMQRWLRMPQYAPLAETHGEFQSPWGPRQGPYGLAPVHPGSLELLGSLYDELLPHFTSRMFNVNCDEAIDLGQGQSKAACQKDGARRVYLEFVKSIQAEVARRGRRMQLWGDMIVQYPELVPELPGDAITLLWGYEAQHPFEQQAELLARSGRPFYVCPGTSSWCSISGRSDNMLANMLNAAESGLKTGAGGFLNTDWGDGGHWQALPVSFPGLAAGAAFSWCLEANAGLDLAAATSLHAFEDPSGGMGKVMLALGNVYLQQGFGIPNGTALFWALQQPLEYSEGLPGWDEQAIQRTEQAIETALQPLKGQQMTRPDADLILEEIQYTVRMLRHACLRSQLAQQKLARLKPILWSDLQELLSQHRSQWLARNRPGGYPESRKRLESLIQDYQ